MTLVLLAILAPVSAQTGSDAIETGRTVFFSRGCSGRHRVGAAETPVAHDLSHVGSKFTGAISRRWLRDPTSQKPTAHMPRLTRFCVPVRWRLTPLGNR